MHPYVSSNESCMQTQPAHMAMTVGLCTGTCEIHLPISSLGKSKRMRRLSCRSGPCMALRSEDPRSRGEWALANLMLCPPLVVLLICVSRRNCWHRCCSLVLALWHSGSPEAWAGHPPHPHLLQWWWRFNPVFKG